MLANALGVMLAAIAAAAARLKNSLRRMITPNSQDAR